MKVLAKDLKDSFQVFLTQETHRLIQRNIQPKLGIIQIGSDLASSKYIAIKQKMATRIGIQVIVKNIPATSPSLTEVKKAYIDMVDQTHGLIFQLPVPETIQTLIKDLPAVQDIDLLGQNQAWLWDQGFLPPTIGAIDLYLKYLQNPKNYNLPQMLSVSQSDLAGKTVMVVGQGKLVGNPLLTYLKNSQANIISINETLPEPQTLSRQADIIISAAGVPNLIDETWLNPDKKIVLIDAATSESQNSLVGDLNYEQISNRHIIVPSPGGIGKLTVFYLFWNLLKLAK